MIWTDNEWWEKNVDRGAAEKAFADAGLPFLFWQNRVPVFDGDVDFEQVQNLCVSQGKRVPAPSTEGLSSFLPEPKESEPVKKPRRLPLRKREQK